MIKPVDTTNYVPRETYDKVLNALWTAEGALVEWHDETTLPFVLQVLDEIYEEKQND
jgi:hypothetical protein